MGFLKRLRGGDKQEAAPAGWNAGTGPPGSQMLWPPRGPITAWPSGDSFTGQLRIMLFDPPPSGAKVEVMGESNYQGSLTALAGGLDLNGPRMKDHRAVLIPEPDNPYDPGAVRVVIVPVGQDAGIWGKVGYLSRQDAVAFRPVIDRLAALGWVTGCRASLKGAQVREDGGRNYIGVTLYLNQPGPLMAELDTDDPKPSWE